MKTSLVFAAVMALVLYVGTARAVNLTYNFGPFTATNGDVIEATATFQNGEIGAYRWEVLRGGDLYTSGDVPSNDFFNGNFTVEGNQLFLAANTSAYLTMGQYSYGHSSPPNDIFQIAAYDNAGGNNYGVDDPSAYGLQIGAGDDIYFAGQPEQFWYVDTSNTPPTQPYLIGTVTTPEPSSVVLVVVGLACFLFCRRQRFRRSVQ